MAKKKEVEVDMEQFAHDLFDTLSEFGLWIRVKNHMRKNMGYTDEQLEKAIDELPDSCL